MPKQVFTRKISKISEYDALSTQSFKQNKKNLEINDKIIKIDGNENPFPLLDDCRQALQEIDSLSYYPDPESVELVKALSKKYDIPSEQIIITAGSDELIDLLFRCLLEKEDRVVSISPTFGIYKFLTELNSGIYDEVETELVVNKKTKGASFKINTEELVEKAKKARITILARPNNPDGGLISEEIIEALLQIDTNLVIDEAYIEFTDNQSMSKKVLTNENLIVLRTFSKAYGLAGIRLGYGMLNSELKKALMKIKQPYNVNSIAQKLGAVVLNKKKVEENISKIKTIRGSFYSDLLVLAQLTGSFSVFKSSSNFILTRFNDLQLKKALSAYLYSNGILVREYNTNRLENYIRFSMATENEMNKVMEKLRYFFEKMGDEIE